MPITFTNFRYYLSDQLDGTIVNTHLVGTTFPNLHHYPLGVSAEIVSVQNIILLPRISVGTNSPYYDNMVTSQYVGNLIVGIKALNLVNDMPILDPGIDIKCKIINSASGVDPVCNFKIIVWGTDRGD